MTLPKEDAQKVVECVRYLNQLGTDVHAMFSAAETLLQLKGYMPIKKEIVLGPSIWVSEPRGWIPEVFGRVYSRAEGRNVVDEEYVIEVHLAPEFAEEPSVVFGKVIFAKKAEASAHYNAWDSYFWLGSKLERGQTQTNISGNEATEVWGGAKEIRVRCLPLFSLRSEGDIKARLVDPFLDLCQKS